MASYQARQRRDPLLDQNTQAALERRGKELFGLCLIGLGLATALIVGTYSPDDPSWLAATNEPAQNALGRFGAAIASPLYVISGYASWGVALVLLLWGGRFMTHRGEERALNRAIFAPIAIAALSVFASTHEPGGTWVHSFGLGGLFGDTVLGALLNIVPATAGAALRILSLVTGVASFAFLLFVLGFDRAELRGIGRFLLIGSIRSYDAALQLLGKGAEVSARGARALQEQNRNRREAKAALAAASDWAVEGPDMDDDLYERYEPAPAQPAQPQPTRRAAVLRAEPRFAQELPEVQPREKGGILSRVTNSLRRAPEPDHVHLEPELVDRGMPHAGWTAPAPTADRVSARIADAVRAKGGTIAQTAALRTEPPLTATAAAARAALAARGLKGPEPLIAMPRRITLANPAVVEENAFLPDPEPVVDLEDDDDLELNAFADLAEDDGQEPIGRPVTSHRVVMPAPAVPATAPTATAPFEARRVVHHSSKSGPSKKAQAEAQPALRFDEGPGDGYEMPPLSLLASPSSVVRHTLSDDALEENARMLESVLDDYGVKGEIVSVRPGPVVTMYELEPAAGLKASRVIGLADDIARSMSALSARVSTVPGRSVIGIELPNAMREKVVLREILASRDFGDGNQRLPLALGKDIAGEPVVANLAKMPHLLIAGTTGSGKSVAINTMILSLLYKLTPEECRLIMIDPKMLELSVYDGIPHLLSPVVTDPKKAVVALKWVVAEMEERYRKMSKMGVRNIEGYNGRVREALSKGEMFKRTVQTGFDEETGDPVFETEELKPVALPYIVVIVDEMADLMMVAGKEIEACIQRLAQMARASGIHLIMATQRPSVDVITGTIKANFPTRISFQVTSKIDSRTILGEQGAEQLLGMGDMLYMAGGSRITRIHGPFVSDEEVEEIVNHLKSFGPPEYMSGVVEGPDEDAASDIDAVLGLNTGGNTDGEDALYDQAVQVVLRDRKVSTSYIQRKLGIGYNKAARLVEQMEQEGLVSAANHVGKREILVPEG